MSHLLIFTDTFYHSTPRSTAGIFLSSYHHLMSEQTSLKEIKKQG